MEEVLETGVYAGAPAAQSARKARPLSFCLAVSIPAAVALVALLATGALNSFSGVDQLARASVPGVVSVNVPRAAEMVVYQEGGVPARLNELGLRVCGPDGVTVGTKPYGLDLRYRHDHRVGRAVASFTAPAAGRYLISTTAAEPGARLAVGGDLGAAIMLTDLATVGVGLAALTAIAIAVALALRCSNGSSRRRHADDLEGRFPRATPPLSLADLTGWKERAITGLAKATASATADTRCRGREWTHMARPPVAAGVLGAAVPSARSESVGTQRKRWGVAAHCGGSESRKRSGCAVARTPFVGPLR